MKEVKHLHYTQETYEKRIQDKYLQRINEKQSWEERQQLLKEYREKRGE
jgi:hypothetical protein